MSVFTKNYRTISDNSLPAFSSWADVPPNLHTRKQWKKLRRKVRKNQQPVARLQWTEHDFTEVERYECDGSVTNWREKILVQKECGLFSEDQTASYRGTRRTWAINIFWNFFVRFTSREHYIWWVNEPLEGGKPRWLNCTGRLQDDHLKKHLKAKEKYGVRGGKWTRFGSIDHDLHEGDRDIFLEQCRILLEEFHGKDGWHFQVANENAGGVHLLQTFRKPILVEVYRESLRKRLQSLDDRYPDLAARARAAGMKTLGELEIFPDTQKGFRLPLCAGRTMLLDHPLELVFDNRFKRDIQDVIGYVTWLSLNDKPYMPAEEVFEFIKTRLRHPQPKPEMVKEKVKTATPKKKAAAVNGMIGSLLGKMKGRYAQVLIDFWSGKLQIPDSLNAGIRLLALTLPYYLNDQKDAVALIEQYIDELPDVSFSDRLSAGNTAEVSRIVANTVRQVYSCNGGQPEPDLSTQKLKATVQAWKKRGFDPTDKSTWDKANAPQSCVLAPEFYWTPDEVIKVGRLQRLLKVSLQIASDAAKWFIRFVKAHKGEIAVPFVKKMLERFGIKCGHNGKANNFLELMRDWDWIRITAYEKWHSRETERKGRARAYAIGEPMVGKFTDDASLGGIASPTGEEERKNLSFTSHRFSPSRLCLVNNLVSVSGDRLLNVFGEVERNKGSPY